MRPYQEVKVYGLLLGVACGGNGRVALPAQALAAVRRTLPSGTSYRRAYWLLDAPLAAALRAVKHLPTGSGNFRGADQAHGQPALRTTNGSEPEDGQQPQQRAKSKHIQRGRLPIPEPRQAIGKATNSQHDDDEGDDLLAIVGRMRGNAFRRCRQRVFSAGRIGIRVWIGCLH